MKQLKFNGSGSEYFKIWIVNLFLTIITLGLYYPWAKVRTKKYFYRSTSLEDYNFEYHATGKQLFLGYLIGFTLLLAYIFLSNIIPFLFIFLVLFIPWIIYRSLKFNFANTSFGNIRFGFEGSIFDTYKYFAVLLIPAIFSYLIMFVASIAASQVSTLLAVVTAIVFLALTFFFYSYYVKEKNVYLMENINYSSSSFISNLSTNSFLKILLKTVLFGIVSFIIFAIAGILLGAIISTLSSPVFIALIMYIVGMGAMVLIMNYYFILQRNYIFENTTLDNISFKSTLKVSRLTYVMITNYIMILCTLGLAYPYAQVRLVKEIIQNSHLNNTDNLQNFLQTKIEKQSAIGEEIGDSFDTDIGAGVGI